MGLIFYWNILLCIQLWSKQPLKETDALFYQYKYWKMYKIL